MEAFTNLVSLWSAAYGLHELAGDFDRIKRTSLISSYFNVAAQAAIRVGHQPAAADAMATAAVAVRFDDAFLQWRREAVMLLDKAREELGPFRDAEGRVTPKEPYVTEAECTLPAFFPVFSNQPPFVAPAVAAAAFGGGGGRGPRVAAAAPRAPGVAAAQLPAMDGAKSLPAEMWAALAKSRRALQVMAVEPRWGAVKLGGVSVCMTHLASKGQCRLPACPRVHAHRVADHLERVSALSGAAPAFEPAAAVGKPAQSPQ